MSTHVQVELFINKSMFPENKAVLELEIVTEEVRKFQVTLHFLLIQHTEGKTFFEFSASRNRSMKISSLLSAESQCVVFSSVDVAQMSSLPLVVTPIQFRYLVSFLEM